jgi:sugar phosphate isomerase/epimerase
MAAAQPIGVVVHSYGIHWRAGGDRHPLARFHDAVTFLEYCHGLGAGGVQVGIGRRDAAYSRLLREQAEAWGMYVEAIGALPRDEADLPRFEAEVRTARESGATVMRTVALSGRRYEVFDRAESWRQFVGRAWHSLTLAEPVVRQHRLRLAVENHKDWFIEDLLGIMRHLSSEYVGILVDTGNSIALLEEPHEVVEAFAPWAISTHFKDMAVAEAEDGFLLSEVPLGRGFLDLPRIIATLTRANPRIHWNLEMITRDPLRIPCFTKKYWATLDALAARQLALAVGRVKAHGWNQPLPRISHLELAAQLKIEDDNARASLAYARAHLGL